jgi:5-methyltetrahydropteroyltriglutamate--homocysteine methyltransferase
MSKTSFSFYTDQRLTGFSQVEMGDSGMPAFNLAGPWARRIETRHEWRAFREYYVDYLPREMPPVAPPTVCTGPITYKREDILQRDLENFKTALGGVNVEEASVPSIAPSMIGRGQNKYYGIEEEYRFAIAQAMKTEYKAIVDAGFILQIDDPGMGETWDVMVPHPTLEEHRKLQAMYVEALNQALKGIPEDRVRYHLCWGSWQGPHLGDQSLRDVVDLVLSVNAGAYSIEAANPRHSWEWRIWEDVKLPDNKVLIPGVIAHTTAVVEHPETVAERITNYARVVGKERVIAGADCGFPRAHCMLDSIHQSCGPNSRRWLKAQDWRPKG